MSKYTDFGDFLQEVVNLVERESSMLQTEKTSDLLKGGWPSFLSATSVFGLTWSGHDSISEDDDLSLETKRVGIKYKERFDSHKGEQRYIDALIEEAVNELTNNNL